MSLFFKKESLNVLGSAVPSLNNSLEPWPLPFLVRFFKLLLKYWSQMISAREYPLDYFVILLNNRRVNSSKVPEWVSLLNIGLSSINRAADDDISILFVTCSNRLRILDLTPWYKSEPSSDKLWQNHIFQLKTKTYSMLTSACDGWYKFCYESRA